MLTSKERANLRSIAQSVLPITQIGKNGICESLINSVDSCLEKREIVKVTVLENSGLNPKEAGIELADKLNAELVCVTGRKIVLYRFSSREDVQHIEY